MIVSIYEDKRIDYSLMTQLSKDILIEMITNSISVSFKNLKSYYYSNEYVNFSKYDEFLRLNSTNLYSINFSEDIFTFYFYNKDDFLNFKNNFLLIWKTSI